MNHPVSGETQAGRWMKEVTGAHREVGMTPTVFQSPGLARAGGLAAGRRRSGGWARDAWAAFVEGAWFYREARQ